jgi:acetyltransferase-like isoleucine patch superfamily enzyme
MTRTVIERYAVVGAQPRRGRQPPARVGPGSVIRSHAVLYRGCTTGARLFCGHGAILREGCRIGADVTIGSQSILDPACVVEDGATIHSHCYLGEETQVHHDAWVGPGVVTLNTKYPKCGHPQRRRTASVIGAFAVVGARAVIMPGVVIGAGALVAAGALVTRSVPPGMLAVGSPARPVRRTATVRCCPGRRYDRTRPR